MWWQRTPIMLRGAVFAVAGGQGGGAAGGLPGGSLSAEPAAAAGLLECPSVDVAMPSLVRGATARARREGFPLSCDPAAGRLLAVLAACLPAGARVVEPGTGTGAGTAWMAAALLPRADVTVITVEKDPGTRPWPRRVTGRVSWNCGAPTHRRAGRGGQLPSHLR
jgi:hypothetical protein